jgi:O-antigen/teichoic acid export membrane protein
MLGWHVFIYVSSRAFAAALNFASVAIFARLAGPADYGEYLLTFAWAYIVYGFFVQWLRYAFFASYKKSAADEQIATFAKTAGGFLAAAMACGLLAGVLNLLPWSTLLGVMVLVIGLTVFDASTEIARTRLQAKEVGQAVILRAVLNLLFGAAALLIYESPLALALAVGAAQVVAIAPLLKDLVPRARAPGSVSTAKGYVRYGLPLVFAFSISALGQNIDRILLASFAGVGVVGPYGAVADMVRQCMVVFGEAIAGAYISIAKNASAGGDDGTARDVLRKAFTAYTTIALFGAAFVIRFEGVAVEGLLGKEFREPTESLVPLFVASSAIFMFRSFYFGQVIYFARSARPELIAAIITAGTVGLLSLLLIPRYGAEGAAIAVLIGQIAACAYYIWEGRRVYAMPVPVGPMFVLGVYAGTGYAITEAVEMLHWPLWLTLIVQFAVLGLAFLLAARTELLTFFRGTLAPKGRMLWADASNKVAP